MAYFIRSCSKPESDLARGYSYPFSEFGNEEQAHEGLSGFELDGGGAANLANYGFVKQHIVIFEGHYVGKGPDGEDLFRPKRIVRAFGWKKEKERDDNFYLAFCK